MELLSNSDNVRSIPSLVDGLNTAQRKVLYMCIRLYDETEVKVCQLVGSIKAKAAYDDGVASLSRTIINMAQKYVGSNNINLLEARGQVGTRIQGGKDSAKPWFIFTKMSPLTRLIFHPNDNPLLKHEYDNNIKIEPIWYIPILPMVLVNGAKIPNYNPRDIVCNLRRMLDGEEPKELIPWYKNFRGTVEFCGDGRYVVSGEISILDDDKLEISELPVGAWTENYKENVLEPMLHGNEKVKAVLADYKNYYTDTTVRFVVTLQKGQMEVMKKEGLHKVFKLQSIINTSSMLAFDEFGCLKRYESVMTILQDFYTLRMKMYDKRKKYLLGLLDAEALKLSNQYRFIMEVCCSKMTFKNIEAIVDEIIKRGFAPDPVKEWKKRQAEEEGEDNDQAEQEESQEDGAFLIFGSSSGESEKNLRDFKNFEYLLDTTMNMLTQQGRNEVLTQKENKLTELETLKNKTLSDLWREDLDVFSEELDKIEEKELADAIAELEVKPQAGMKEAPIMETLPSPRGQRVEPIITEDIKKKIQQAKRNEESSGKIMKENIAEEDNDESNEMLKSKKTLKDKLGTPEEISKKSKKKKGESDGLKQTKLNSPKGDESDEFVPTKDDSDNDDNPTEI